MRIIAKNQTDTKAFAKMISENLSGGDILLLEGEMGAGKTTFTKALAEHLGIKDEIVSPTFTLMNLYQADFKDIKNLVHIDTYRLKDETELLGIGAEDYVGKNDTLSVIEWPEKIPEILHNKKTKKIEIKSLSENEREFTFSE